MKLDCLLILLPVFVAGVASLETDTPEETTLENTPELRIVYGSSKCRSGKNDWGCGCGKPPPGPCGCDISVIDYGCGCGNPPPGECGCNLHCEPLCDGWDNHIWLYDDHNKCIQYDDRNPNQWVGMGPCATSDPYQQWFFRRGFIKSVQDPSKCLAYKEGGHDRQWLYVTRCRRYEGNQRWDYVNSRITPVNLPGKCVDVCRDCGDLLYIENCETKRDKDQKFLVGDCFYGWN